MRKIYLALVFSLLATSLLGYSAYAQSDYYMSEQEYREAKLDNMQNQGDIQQYELDSKIAAAEEIEERESAEAAEANKQLLIYVAIGVVGIIVIFLITHSVQKPKSN
ncbi:hypothetical protein H7X69_03005, partial [Candidatus Saccharibacteria bacterium]|nr:hypothetical protein [Candidatus Saccharibacteria bacterium]